MATVDYSQLYAKAIEEAGVGSEVLPDGTYRLKVGSVKRGASKSNSKPQIGIRLVALEGPHQGKSTWVNQTFTADNPQAVAIFLRTMKSFGVPQEAIDAGTPPDALADYIVVGSEGVGELAHHVYGTDPVSGQPKKFQDIKKFTLTSLGDATGTVVAGVPQIAQQPQAPVPVAPAPAQAAPVEIPVPQPVVTPQPVAPVATQAGTPPF